MTDRPILFSAPMVRAILYERKTQTRRVVKPQPVDRGGGSLSISYAAGKMNHMGPANFMLEKLAQYGCPYGKTGDRLWVREAFFIDGGKGSVRYRASGHVSPFGWKPSIHMPRWASRITLEITGVRVERLQDISNADAMSEGIEEYLGIKYTGEKPPADGRIRFSELWTEINGPYSWSANPFVWVIEFKRVMP